jgi:hypothetical protein
MTFTWNDIVAVYLSQPWWVWLAAVVLAWLGARWLTRAIREYAERPIITDSGFEQSGVRVDYKAKTITLPRGATVPVSCVRGMRWEDYARSGYYHAIVEIDDLKTPLHPVLFSKPGGPEIFVSRLRGAIERAGGPKFVVRSADRIDVVERDLSNPVMAATAARVADHGHKVSLAKVE